ncbi:MAG TPA: hypothetical protein VK978_01410 [Candidatus Saccharimonadales bacterium]|nr:hypothetical protein [Candidatus Saccharimonadales bacterium]
MANIRYINTQEIRRDLLGFLQELANGQRYVVLNRSKPIVTLQGERTEPSPAEARRRIQAFLDAAATARASATITANMNTDTSYKDLYYDDMAEKYGISGR